MSKINYWKDTDILDIELGNSQVEYAKEIAPGVVLEFSKSGEIVGLEIMKASAKMDAATKKSLQEKYAVLN